MNAQRLRALRAFDLAVLGMALFCAAGLWRVIAVMGFQLPLDPNEGWNAYHAAAAMSGSPLYPGAQSYLVNNYPPVSYYVAGVLGRLFDDYIIAGRIVSLLSFGFVAFGIFAVSVRMGVGRMAAIFAALLFAGGMLVFTDYVGMDDPQMLAHALAMTGFLLLLNIPRGKYAVVLAALLFVLAAFTKHNVIVMAAAMAAWLSVYDRKSAVRLIIFGVLFLLIGLALFRAVYGTSLLAQLTSARSYSFEALGESLAAWLRWSVVTLIGLGALVFLYRREPRIQLCAGYAVAGIALGTIFLGGAGVDANVLFDADIALALGAGLALDRMAARMRAAAAAAFAAPLLFSAWAYYGSTDWTRAGYWLHPMREEAALAKSDIAFLKSHRGPAICEMLSFCYWGQKPPAVDVFNVGQQFDTNTRSDAELVRRVEAHDFAVIQFDPDSPYSLGENIHNAMARHYRLDHTDDFGDFYVPR